MENTKEQIELAQQYKRNVPQCLSDILDLCTSDVDTAISCFYVLLDSNKKHKTVIGLSARS